MHFLWLDSSQTALDHWHLHPVPTWVSGSHIQIWLLSNHAFLQLLGGYSQKTYFKTRWKWKSLRKRVDFPCDLWPRVSWWLHGLNHLCSFCNLRLHLGKNSECCLAFANILNQILGSSDGTVHKSVGDANQLLLYPIMFSEVLCGLQWPSFLHKVTFDETTFQAFIFFPFLTNSVVNPSQLDTLLTGVPEILKTRSVSPVGAERSFCSVMRPLWPWGLLSSPTPSKTLLINAFAAFNIPQNQWSHPEPVVKKFSETESWHH